MHITNFALFESKAKKLKSVREEIEDYFLPITDLDNFEIEFEPLSTSDNLESMKKTKRYLVRKEGEYQSYKIEISKKSTNFITYESVKKCIDRLSQSKKYKILDWAIQNNVKLTKSKGVEQTIKITCYFLELEKTIISESEKNLAKELEKIGYERETKYWSDGSAHHTEKYVDELEFDFFKELERLFPSKKLTLTEFKTLINKELKRLRRIIPDLEDWTVCLEDQVLPPNSPEITDENFKLSEWYISRKDFDIKIIWLYDDCFEVHIFG